MDVLNVTMDRCDDHHQTACPVHIIGATKGTISFKAKEDITDLDCKMYGEVGTIRSEFPRKCPSGCTSLESGQSCPIAANTVVTYDFFVIPGTFFGMVS